MEINIKTEDIMNNTSAPGFNLNEVISIQNDRLKELIFSQNTNQISLGLDLLKDKPVEQKDSVLVDNSNTEISEIVKCQNFYIGFWKMNKDDPWIGTIPSITSENAFSSVMGHNFKKVVKISLNDI